MTNEEINIEIAEACGWLKVGQPSTYRTPVWLSPDHEPGDIGGHHTVDELPDYCNDLNAMHEAEKVLSFAQCNLFSEHLNKIIDNEEEFEGYESENFIWHATAKQHAEAFLRVFGKWEE